MRAVQVHNPLHEPNESVKIVGVSDQSHSAELPSSEGPEPRFEENLKKLESIVTELERGESSLDRALELYEEGVRAYKSCHKALEAAESRVNKLVETLEGELREEPFEAEEEEGD
jgi:exodeoxyribonuclease VII small subunit